MNQPATWIKRVINLIVDLILIQYLLFYLFSLILSKIDFEKVSIDLSNFEFLSELLFLIIFFLYYFLMEFYTHKTIGKYLTGTKVVSSDGSKLVWDQILLRSILRIFFIEILTFFKKRPKGWHDSFSDTIVVDSR